MARYIEDMTSEAYATWLDREAERENQQNWFFEEYREAHLCAAIPAAAEYFRAIHMQEDIPF
jgi:hypothetical protein